MNSEQARSPIEDTLLVIAIAFLETGKLQKALAYCERVLEINRDHKRAQELKDTITKQYSSISAGIDAHQLEEPIKKLLIRALQAFEVGQIEDALTYCDKALLDNPESLAVLGVKADFLSSVERYSDLIPCYKSILNLKPNDALTWVKLGICWMHLEDWKEMLKCDEQAIKVRPDLAQAWVGKAIALTNLGRGLEAIEDYQRALSLEPNTAYFEAINQIKEGKNNSKFGLLIRRLLKILLSPIIVYQFKKLIFPHLEKGLESINQQNYDEAINQYERVVQLCEVNEFEELALSAWQNLGICYLHIKNYERSIQASQRAFELGTKKKDLITMESAIGNMGLAYIQLKQLEKAEEALNQALSIAEKANNFRYQDKWRASLAQIYLLNNSMSEGISQLEKIITQSKINNESWKLQLNLASALKFEGNWKEAIKIGNEIISFVPENLPLKEQFDLNIGLGDIYSPPQRTFSLAGKLRNTSDSTSTARMEKEAISKACGYFKESLRIAEKLNDLSAQARSLFQIIAHSLSEDTIPYAERGLKISRILEDREMEYLFLMAIVNEYADQFRPKEAERYIKEAAQIAPTDPSVQMWLLYHQGGISLGLGNLTKAYELTIESLQHAKGCDDKILEIWCLGQLFNICKNLGELHLAESYANQMIVASEKYAGEPVNDLAIGGLINFEETTEANLIKAQTALENGDFHLASSIYSEVVEFFENASNSLPLSSHKVNVLRNKNSTYWEAITISILAEHFDQTLEILELTKTRELKDVVADRDQISGIVPDKVLLSYLEAEKEEQVSREIYWSTLSEQIANSSRNAIVDIIEDYEKSWLAAKNKLFASLEEIRLYKPEYSKPEISSSISIQEIFSLSQKCSAIIIELVVTKSFVGALIVESGKTKVEFVEFDTNGNHLQTLIATYKEKIDHLTKELWIIFIEPIIHILKESENNRIIFIPSKITNLLPFHAACFEKDGKNQYLLDEYEISFAPSLTILNQCKIRSEERSFNSKLLSITSPFHYTPFSDEEIVLIQSLYQEKASFVFNNQRDLRSLKNNIYEAGHLHICSHGTNHGLLLLDDSVPDKVKSDINALFGELSDWFGEYEDDYNEDLDVSSNLLLDNTSLKEQPVDPYTAIHPGILSAVEIESMDLSHTRLVTLSACESGLTDSGGLFGDEYLGLPASFIIAGVPTVVASLWKVSGVSTALLMWKFYTNLMNEHQSVSQALRNAQLWLKNVHRDEVINILEKLRLWHHHRSQNLSETDPEYVKVRKSFWLVESAINWVIEQSGIPFSEPYWWAGFQVIGWPDIF